MSCRLWGPGVLVVPKSGPECRVHLDARHLASPGRGARLPRCQGSQTCSGEDSEVKDLRWVCKAVGHPGYGKHWSVVWTCLSVSI
ncbi:hypothetical protein NDU88_001188 [Pleurodeles waltl]|uniref:Uncharacterized protein n=1 Tax=Pleurodeles waltl TaxID=8319 RepID=A0AAV7MJT3_PLEWA|nr:hypothetical protein NDU88_001188 [Pleurodeles waltl]